MLDTAYVNTLQILAAAPVAAWAICAKSNQFWMQVAGRWRPQSFLGDEYSARFPALAGARKLLIQLS